MGKLTISIGPWLPVRYVRNYQRVAPMFLGMVTIPPKEKMVIFLGDGAFYGILLPTLVDSGRIRRKHGWPCGPKTVVAGMAKGSYSFGDFE